MKFVISQKKSNRPFLIPLRIVRSSGGWGSEGQKALQNLGWFLQEKNRNRRRLSVLMTAVLQRWRPRCARTQQTNNAGHPP